MSSPVTVPTKSTCLEGIKHIVEENQTKTYKGKLKKQSLGTGEGTVVPQMQLWVGEQSSSNGNKTTMSPLEGHEGSRDIRRIGRKGNAS